MKISLNMDRRGEMEVRMKMEGRRKANQNDYIFFIIDKVIIIMTLNMKVS